MFESFTAHQNFKALRPVSGRAFCFLGLRYWVGAGTTIEFSSHTDYPKAVALTFDMRPAASKRSLFVDVPSMEGLGLCLLNDKEVLDDMLVDFHG